MSQDAFSASSTILQARVVAVAKIGSALFNLAAQIYLARYLNINDYAVFTLFVASTSLLVFLSMYGVDRVAYRVIPPIRLQSRWREISILFGISLLWRLILIGLGGAFIWAIPKEILPQALVRQLSSVVVQLLVFVLAMSMTDSMSVFCNSIGRQAAQSKALLLVGFSRSTTIVVLLHLRVETSLQWALWVFVGSELLFLLLLLAVIVNDLLRQRSVSNKLPFKLGIRYMDALVEGGATQLSYMLRVPFGGPFLRLLVGSFAPPLLTAAYGFYQTLADRLYQFLPPILFKGALEPALSADYSIHQDMNRVAVVVSVLLKMSLALIAALLSFTLGMGEPIVNSITNGKYGSEILVACLVCIQLASQVIGEILWIALNPIGRVVTLNKVWYGMTVFAGIGLALAYVSQNAWVILAIAPMPYFAVAIWLRYVLKEPMLVEGIGSHVIFRLMLPSAMAALTGRISLSLLGESVLGLCGSVLFSCVSFLLVLAAMRIFLASEVRLAGHFSPLLAKLIRPFAARA